MYNRTISFRFSIALIAIFALIMGIFAIFATSIMITQTSDELNAKLENYLRISVVGLETPLWNFDHDTIEGYLDSLMLDNSLVFVSVTGNDDVVISRKKSSLKELQFDDFTAMDDYNTIFSDVEKDDEKIGRIEMVLSRAELKQQIQTYITAILVLTLFLLLTITAASVVISRRYVSQPLANLQQSASAIGAGNLETEIDITGEDEVGALARAFDNMRNSIRQLVGELKQTNEKLETANQTLEERVEQRTKEVMVTQQKLIDAIDSTSEGFAFFDSNDQLVLHNAQYDTLLHSGSDIKIEPGMSFEQILRLGGESGLILSETEDFEAFVKERMEQHRNPGAPFLQRRKDNIWIQISERKTSDGGTVAVFSNVSDLKNREADLTEKTEMLGHLSNQLAKYLSPQVYDSIFHGGQEVKVTSSRKKLTVFFSDIEGFTETAEQMESEELTNLLNNYLTEMSKIAMEFGGTIDKYIGDAILIFFGDPESQGVKEDAIACVNMAIAMSKRMEALQQDWQKSGILRPLNIRIGIHTDYCTVGNFGSESRMDYTIIGRGVNTASRLESSAEPGKIMISYATYAQVNNQIPCVSKGQIKVKGIHNPIDVYEVIVAPENVQPEPASSPPPANLSTVDLTQLNDDEKKKFVVILKDMLSRLSTN